MLSWPLVLAQSTEPSGPSRQPLQVFGTRLIGVSPENGRKLLITLVFVVGVILLGWVLRSLASLVIRGHRTRAVVFWIRQGIAVFLTIVVLIGVLSIWFDNPSRFATFMGLVTAGVAFALQKPISALAGYLVILRGRTFGIGDRITMGGVRGDVLALGFIQTTIMEMGQPPAVQNADPAMWVQARQYTGRIVTVSNSKVFDEPIYNYTREFPYLWEEVRLPISYKDDRHAAERILLDVAARHTVKVQDLSREAIDELCRRYFMQVPELTPRVYLRLTDNWIEMALRFVCRTYGIRELKDAMSREILAAFDRDHISIASSTYDVVGMPPLRVSIQPDHPPGALPGPGARLRDDT